MTQLELLFLPESVGDRRNAGRLAVCHPPTFLDRIKAIPGFRWSTLGKVSTLPRGWPSVLALGTVSQTTGVPLAPDAEVKAWYKKSAEEWKTLRKLSATLGVGEKAEGLSYYPHQVAGSQWLLADTEMRGRILLDETGIGKTGTFIAAVQQGQLHKEGPILVVCPESVITTGWLRTLQTFGPELRFIKITGNATQRSKKLAQVRAGEFDVAILGYSNLRTSSRFEAAPGKSLRRCIACGGPRLTSGLTDENGKPIPDIEPGHELHLSEEGSQVVCDDTLCDYVGTLFTGEDADKKALAEGEAHTKETKGRTIREVTEAQCQVHMKDLNTIGWSVIIADEAHRALNHESQTAQALNGVGKYAPGEPRRWAATGTPISKQIDQAWVLLHFADPVSWPNGSRSKWVDWYCNAGYNWAGFWEVFGWKEERKDEFQATYTGITRRVLKEQVLKDLPPKLRGGSLEEHLTMGGEQLRVYNEMRDEMLALVDEGAITAKDVLVQAGRLSLLASGTGYPISDTEIGIKPPSVKLERLIEMWKDGEWKGEQVAFLFTSRKALRMVEERIYAEGLATPMDLALICGGIPQKTRDLDIEDFQSGKRKTVLLTYAAGGTGITLTAASTVIVFERNWSSILNVQGEDRFHRIGSERHAAITYRDLVVANSNEIAQLARLDEKAEALESIVHDRDKLRALFGG
jgi:SNF2 family DNA or RNA helicase